MKLRFKREKLNYGGRALAVKIEAYEQNVKKGPWLGRVIVKQAVADAPPFVSNVVVDDPHLRSGIGTKLYEEAAKVACQQFKQPLHSDEERSLPAQRFWEKQVRKGRATCVERVDEHRSHDDSMPIKGRGGCVRYRLTCPAPRTLQRPR